MKLFGFVFAVFFLIHNNAYAIKLGVFTGTMDPPHKNHINMAKTAVSSFKLERMYIIPNYDPTHKPGATPYDLRKQMSAYSFSNIKNTQLLDPEDEQKFKESNVSELIKDLLSSDKELEIYHVTGSDSFLRSLERFKTKYTDYPELKGRYTVIVNLRSEDDREELEQVIDSLQGILQVSMFKSDSEEISSTDIRNAIASGDDTSDFLEKRTIKVIQENGLYRADSKDHKCTKELTSKKG